MYSKTHLPSSNSNSVNAGQIILPKTHVQCDASLLISSLHLFSRLPCPISLHTVLENPGVGLHLLERKTVLGIKDKELGICQHKPRR